MIEHELVKLQGAIKPRFLPLEQQSLGDYQSEVAVILSFSLRKHQNKRVYSVMCAINLLM